MLGFFFNRLQPDLELAGLVINEPVTTITGLLIALSCWYAYRQLKAEEESGKARRYMLLFFIFLGWSNVFGSLAGHAFQDWLGLHWKIPGWSLGMAAVFMVGQVSILRWGAANGSDRTPRLLTAINLAAFVALLWLSIQDLNFAMVETYSAVGLLLIMLPLEALLSRDLSNKSSQWMIWALAPAVLAVLLHIAKFSFSVWFNFFDIGHVLLCVTVWLFLQGAKLMPA